MKTPKMAKLFALLLSLTLLILTAGCDVSDENDKYSGSMMKNGQKIENVKNDGQTEKPSQSLENNSETSENQQPEKTQSAYELKTKIYFSDDQEMNLIAENLTLADGSDVEKAAQEVIAALIAGPKNSSLLPTIPSGTRLLGVKVSNGLATVDFSAELRDNHSGGSSGENMTVYSIVDSLTELKGIDRVQILIEGQKVDTLAGHIDLQEPLESDF